MEEVYRQGKRGTQMDNNFSLARQEEVRRSVLLASSGDGVPRKARVYRNARKALHSPAEGTQGEAAIHTAAESKSNAKDKGRNGRGRKRRRTYPPRETVRDAEGGNCPSGRSAQELGIKWLEARCDDSPTSKAHYLVAKTDTSAGVIFECKYCHKVTWLPASLDECERLNTWMHIYGKDGGYQRILDLHPAAKRLLSKIQDIYYLKKSLPPEQFPLALAAVMMDREYPYDVDVTEEEIL